MKILTEFYLCVAELQVTLFYSLQYYFSYSFCMITIIVIGIHDNGLL